MINRPELPPRAGYVEVEDANGQRVYAPTPETIERLRKEQEAAQTQADIDAMTVDHELRLTMLELGV